MAGLFVQYLGISNDDNWFNNLKICYFGKYLKSFWLIDKDFFAKVVKFLQIWSRFSLLTLSSLSSFDREKSFFAFTFTPNVPFPGKDASADFFSTFLDGKDSGKCDQMDAKIVIKRLTIYDNDT